MSETNLGCRTHRLSSLTHHCSPALTQTANISRRISIEIPFYRAIQFHCLCSERTKTSPPRHHSWYSHGTSNGITSDESARRIVRYYYFNFMAEPSRIYLGARLMSLEDYPWLGVNADRRSERACAGLYARITHQRDSRGWRADLPRRFREGQSHSVHRFRIGCFWVNVSIRVPPATSNLHIERLPLQTFLSSHEFLDQFGINFLFNKNIIA